MHDFAAGEPGVEQHDEGAAEAEEPGMVGIDGDFPDEEEGGEKAGEVGTDDENAVSGKGTGETEEEGLEHEDRAAGDAGEKDDDARSEEREALGGIRGHDFIRIDFGKADKA